MVRLLANEREKPATNFTKVGGLPGVRCQLLCERDAEGPTQKRTRVRSRGKVQERTRWSDTSLTGQKRTLKERSETCFVYHDYLRAVVSRMGLRAIPRASATNVVAKSWKKESVERLRNPAGATCWARQTQQERASATVNVEGKETSRGVPRSNEQGRQSLVML
jgi:hypothetical protein